VNVREYFAFIQSGALAAPHVIETDLSFEEISESECYIRGKLTLGGGFELHVAEYVLADPEFRRLKYRYHLQTAKGKLIARWDNAPHHPEVSTHPNHFHSAENKIRPSEAMDILRVLDEIVSFIE